MYRGWDDSVATELVALSSQPHILEFTPNDAARRFTNKDSANEWYHQHQRVMYTIGETAITGIIWFGEASSEHTDGDFTFAIRMYEAARGQGLARHFMQAAHLDFRETMDYHNVIWLETDITNTAARTLYERAGYDERLIVDERVVMTQSERP